MMSINYFLKIVLFLSQDLVLLCLLHSLSAVGECAE
jgi:hypothetical protein